MNVLSFYNNYANINMVVIMERILVVEDDLKYVKYYSFTLWGRTIPWTSSTVPRRRCP
jgi:hypothetical protein